MFCLSVCLSVNKHAFALCECQELIAIIFVLLLPCFNLCRKTDFEVRTDGIKIIQNIDDAFLNIK